MGRAPMAQPPGHARRGRGRSGRPAAPAPAPRRASSSPARTAPRGCTFAAARDLAHVLLGARRSRSASQPMVRSSLSMVPTSARSGTLRKVCSPSASSAEARMGSAAFLAPETRTSPFSAAAALHDDLVHGLRLLAVADGPRAVSRRPVDPAARGPFHARRRAYPAASSRSSDGRRPASSPISSARSPPGSRRPARPPRCARTSVEPVRRRRRAPAAARGAPRADSVGISAGGDVGRIGDHDVEARASPATGAKSRPGRTVTRLGHAERARRCRAPPRRRPGERSVASTAACGRSAARVMAMQPEPVQRSSTRPARPWAATLEHRLDQQLGLGAGDEHPRVDGEAAVVELAARRSGTASARRRCAARSARGTRRARPCSSGRSRSMYSRPGRA